MRAFLGHGQDVTNAFILFCRLFMHLFTGCSVGGSKKMCKGDVFYLMFLFMVLLTLVLDSFKVDHPVAAQSVSSTSLKRLLHKRASDKVGKAKSSCATRRNA
jgi:hypothetical protein